MKKYFSVKFRLSGLRCVTSLELFNVATNTAFAIFRANVKWLDVFSYFIQVRQNMAARRLNPDSLSYTLNYSRETLRTGKLHGLCLAVH
jgi:hypothetical protein